MVLFLCLGLKIHYTRSAVREQVKIDTGTWSADLLGLLNNSKQMRTITHQT